MRSTLDDKRVSAGLAALGVLALAMAGYVRFTTPAEQQCRTELANERVRAAELMGSCRADLADAKARIELLSEAKAACKNAIDRLMESPR